MSILETGELFILYNYLTYDIIEKLFAYEKYLTYDEKSCKLIINYIYLIAVIKKQF